MTNTRTEHLPGALLPGQPGYDQARRVWNGMIDRRPAVIARCHTANEVSAAVRFAVAEGLPLTVRGGGHNVAGLALADRALLVDLSPMRSVTLDAAAGVAFAEGGALLADVDAATLPAGLACPTGVVADTGLGGLALGGGYGWLARKWGLTCDHILSAEVVLADGTVVVGSERRRPELLWGLRGGGGNFGVVTRFELRLRPVGDVWYESAIYPIDDAARALRAYRETAPGQPDDLQIVAVLKHAPQAGWIPAALRGRPVLAVTAVWLGEPADGEARCRQMFDSAPPAARHTQRMSFARLQSLGDGSEPAGRRYYTKSCYLGDVTDSVAETLVSVAELSPSRYSTIDLGYLLGAIARVPEDATAFPGRQAPYICSASAAWDDPADDAAATAWARGLIDGVAEARAGGSYVNYTQADGGGAAAIYGQRHHARLARLKAEVDPANVFRGNHNIQPSGT